MIYLSNFRSKLYTMDNAISIARFPPRGWKGAVRKDLAPSAKTLKAFKDGKITDVEYISEYIKIIYSHDLDQLAEELDNHVLLCFCEKNAFCHRILLASILNIETGIEVEEIGGFAENWKDLIKNKTRPMNILIDDEDKDKYNLHDKFEHDNIIGHWRELKDIGVPVTEFFSDFY